MRMKFLWRRWFFVILILLSIFLFAISEAGAFPEKDQPVDVIKVKGPIFASTARYINRGIKEAEADQAICIIEMDTPGGLVSSMREIVQDISASKVPVVVFVYPQGSMATSAGTYICYAANVVAMAPGTHIGSAHPVAMGGNNRRFIPLPMETPTPPGAEPEKEGKKKEETPSGTEVDVGMEKATNAMVALIRSLAEKNHRNADWAEKAVRESVSITASEAVKENVAEIVAENLPDLLEKLKGREVILEGKKTIVLQPSQDRLKYIEMTGIERFLLTINDPQIAMILMFLGVMGLYYELSTPGAIIPGIVGGICIILGLYTLGSLPINYAALALIILSVILFMAEIFTPTFGAFTIGGIIAFTLGAVFLIPAGMPYLAISRGLIISLALFMGAFSFIIINVAVKSIKRAPFMGQSSMMGKKVLVKKDLAPQGLVMMDGELWKAKTLGDDVPAGKAVSVEEVQGLLLLVKEIAEK